MPNIESQILLAKHVFPTALSSENIRLLWSDRLRDAAVFSAKTTSKTYLDAVKDILIDYKEKIAQTIDNQGKPAAITEGVERTRREMMEALAQQGLFSPSDNEGGIDRIQKLGSKLRLDLIIRTNSQLAHSEAQKMVSSDPLQQILNPCWELVRDEYRMHPRGTNRTMSWEERWLQAGESINWDGCCPDHSKLIAKKDSPIWSAIGHMFDDSIGTDRPPFWFMSGCGWRDVDRQTAINLGFDL